MNPRWLLTASRWARHPPPARRVWLLVGVIVICLVLAGLDRVFGGSVTFQPDRLRPFTPN